MLKLSWRLTIYELYQIFVASTLFLVILWVWKFPLSHDDDFLVQNDIESTVHVIMESETELCNNPVIYWTTDDFPNIKETLSCPNNLICDVINNKHKIKNVRAYLFYASSIDFNKLPLPRNPSIIWGLLHEESPRNVEEFFNDNILSLFNYSSTISRYSDVPFTLQNMGSLESLTTKKYYVEISEKNQLKIAPVLYIQSDCDTSTERDEYVKELMNLIEIDSYGACLNNKDLPKKFKDDYLNSLNDDEFLRFVARYKFVIAIENGVCEDYITEKLWRPIKVGSIPIYFGSPSIRDWLPNEKSAILLQDFPTPELLNKHIKSLMNNDSLYEEYLEHKTKGLITNKRIIDEINNRPYQLDIETHLKTFNCFICEKIHDNEREMKINIIDRSHYNCPKPISALTQDVNPKNPWVQQWNYSLMKSEQLYQKIVNTK